MYGKSKKRRKVKQKTKVSATTTTNSSNNHPGVVTNDGSQNGPTNDKPTLIKRNSSFQDFNAVKAAPRIAANTAAKIVTGVDMNGMARAQQSIRQMEDEEQQRDFVHNSMGQPVYVGRNKKTGMEKRLSGSGSGGGLSPKGGSSEENLDDLLAGVFTAPPPAAADVGKPVVVKDPEMGFCNDEDNDLTSDEDNELSDGDDNELSDKMYSHPQDRGNPFLVSRFPLEYCHLSIHAFANHCHFFACCVLSRDGSHGR